MSGSVDSKFTKYSGGKRGQIRKNHSDTNYRNRSRRPRHSWFGFLRSLEGCRWSMIG